MAGSDCRACGDPAVAASIQPLPMEAILSGPAYDGELAHTRGGPAGADGSAGARGTPGAGHPAAARGTPSGGHPNAHAPSGPGRSVEHRARMSSEPGASSTPSVVDGTPARPRSGVTQGSWRAGEPSTAEPSSAGASSAGASSSAETLGSSTQCPACRSSVGAAQVFCDACGFRVRTRRKRAEQPDRIRCLECGHREPSRRASCGNCGMRFRR